MFGPKWPRQSVSGKTLTAGGLPFLTQHAIQLLCISIALWTDYTVRSSSFRRRSVTMTLGDLDIPLSIIPTILALLSFCGEAWRIWRDRPRLSFYVFPVNFVDVPKVGDLHYARILVCNIGYRPIILTQFAAFGATSSFSMGIHDEPALIAGKPERKFPALIDPGQSLELHPLSIAAIKRNAEKPEADNVHHDPWRYFVLIDSFGRFHPIDMDDVHWNLRLSNRRIRTKWWQKPTLWVSKRWCLRKARKRLSL